MALIVLPMLEGWVPGHLSSVAPIYYEHKNRGKWKRITVQLLILKQTIKKHHDIILMSKGAGSIALYWRYMENLTKRKYVTLFDL